MMKKMLCCVLVMFSANAFAWDDVSASLVQSRTFKTHAFKKYVLDMPVQDKGLTTVSVCRAHFCDEGTMLFYKIDKGSEVRTVEGCTLPSKTKPGRWYLCYKSEVWDHTGKQ